jgi:hypothetical protein
MNENGAGMIDEFFGVLNDGTHHPSSILYLHVHHPFVKPIDPSFLLAPQIVDP